MSKPVLAPALAALALCAGAAGAQDYPSKPVRLLVTLPVGSSADIVVPSIAEAGLPGFDVSAWFGLSAPVRTAESIVQRLNAEANRVLKMPPVRENLNRQGMEVHGGTPQDYGRHIEAELARWAKVVKATGIRLD